jgi:uncharacterized protein YkwD
MMRLGRAMNRIVVVRPAAWLPVLLLLTLLVVPTWGQQEDGTPLAIGYIDSDGETGLVEYVAAEPLQSDSAAAAGLGIPAESPGHQLVRLTNVRRTNQGLPPLKAASELMDSSQYHSDWMASHNCFEHNCPGEPQWVQRIVNAGYVSYVGLGENIAAGHPSANDAVQAWMGSEGHRANMLNPAFREAGGGYAYAANSTYRRYWTMDYGARNADAGGPAYPLVIDDEAWSTTSLQVDLYVYGQGWAQDMRFSNDGHAWSSWQSFSPHKTWTLALGGGSLVVVYGQIRRGITVLDASDSIYLDRPLTVAPETMVFLSGQGSPTLLPTDYDMRIETPGAWTAVPDRSWIRLSSGSGTGPANVMVHLEGYPTAVGTYTGSIEVESLQMVVQVQVRLCVTHEALQEGHVTFLAKG